MGTHRWLKVLMLHMLFCLSFVSAFLISKIIMLQQVSRTYQRLRAQWIQEKHPTFACMYSCLSLAIN